MPQFEPWRCGADAGPHADGLPGRLLEEEQSALRLSITLSGLVLKGLGLAFKQRAALLVEQLNPYII